MYAAWTRASSDVCGAANHGTVQAIPMQQQLMFAEHLSVIR